MGFKFSAKTKAIQRQRLNPWFPFLHLLMNLETSLTSHRKAGTVLPGNHPSTGVSLRKADRLPCSQRICHVQAGLEHVRLLSRWNCQSSRESVTGTWTLSRAESVLESTYYKSQPGSRPETTALPMDSLSAAHRKSFL